MRTWSPGICSVAALAAVVLSSYAPAPVGFAVIALLGALFGVFWPHYAQIPAKKTLGAVFVLISVTATVIARVALAPAFLTWVSALLAVGIGVVFLVQLIRGTGQSHRLESLFASIAGLAIAIGGSGWIAVSRLPDGGVLLPIAGVSALIVFVLGMLSWPDRIVAPLGLVLAGLAAPLAGVVFSGLPIVPAIGVGFVVAAVLLGFRRLATMSARPSPAKASAWIAVGIAPVLALGIMIYFTERLLPL